VLKALYRFVNCHIGPTDGRSTPSHVFPSTTAPRAFRIIALVYQSTFLLISHKENAPYAEVQILRRDNLAKFIVLREMFSGDTALFKPAAHPLGLHFRCLMLYLSLPRSFCDLNDSRLFTGFFKVISPFSKIIFFFLFFFLPQKINKKIIKNNKK